MARFRKFHILVASLLLISCKAPPEVQQIPSAPPQEPWSWSDSEFSVDLILTDRHSEFIEQWSSLSKNPNKWPLLYVKESVGKRHPVYALVVFSGCPLSPDGGCALSIDYVVYRPDKTEYGSQRARTLWTEEEPAPKNGLIYVGNPYLQFIAEDADPYGKYEFAAAIYTLRNPKGIKLRRTLRVLNEP